MMQSALVMYDNCTFIEHLKVLNYTKSQHTLTHIRFCSNDLLSRITSGYVTPG